MANEKSSTDRPVSFLLKINHISKNDEDRRIVAGYGSLDVIDRQGERITQEAMKLALEKFMANPEFANTHVMHGNLAVGKVIPEYIDKNGEKWQTEVNDTGTFIVSELRTDILRANQTWELIQDGKLKSYSVGGLAISPKEQVCTETGACHWEISEMEIHEFSYVDRPAVQGADFIIVKNDEGLNIQLQNNDLPPKAMTCPLEKPEKLEQTYKEESPKSDTIIMTGTQADASEATGEPEQEISEDPKATEEIVEDADKADATPTLLELKAQNERILNLLEQVLKPPEKEQKFDYPEEDVKVLQDTYGEENTFHLFSILGDSYTLLLDKAKEELAEEAKVKAEPEAEAKPEPSVPYEPLGGVKVEPEETKEKVVEEPVKAPEAETPTPEPETVLVPTLVEGEPAKKSEIVEEVKVAIDAKLKELDDAIESIEKTAKVQKRSPGPTAETPKGSLIDRVGSIKWGHALDELANEGV